MASQLGICLVLDQPKSPRNFSSFWPSLAFTEGSNPASREDRLLFLSFIPIHYAREWNEVKWMGWDGPSVRSNLKITVFTRKKWDLGPLSGGEWVQNTSQGFDQMPEPPQLVPFDMDQQRLYSKPFPGDWAPYPVPKVGQTPHPAHKGDWAPHSVPKGAPSHHTEGNHFGGLCLRSGSFGHCQKLMNIRVEMWIRLVNPDLCLSAQLFLHHNRLIRFHYHRWCTACWCRAPSFFHLRQGFFTDSERTNHFFLVENMASDLEVLIPIQVVTHFKLPQRTRDVLAWWSQHDDIIIKKEGHNQVVLNWKPSGPWLHLEIQPAQWSSAGVPN